jgi:hypothetical protein
MSLFNPNYVGLRLLDNGYIPQLGIGVPWTVLVLTLHVVWSVSVPIALVEALFYSRRTEPWLGRIGLVVTGVVFLFGCAATTATSVAQSGFVATTPQLTATFLIAVLLIVVGLVVVRPGTGETPGTAGHAPRPWLVGAAAFVISSAFKQLPPDWSPWLYVGLVLALALLSIGTVWIWSRHRDWGDAQRLALAAGPLFTYAWTGFPQPPVMAADPTVDLIGNAVFAIGAIALVVVAAMRLRRRSASDERTPHDDAGTPMLHQRSAVGAGR